MIAKITGIISVLLLVVMLIMGVFVMDALTYGGLWKNPTWQTIRKAVGNDWGPNNDKVN